MYLAAKHSKCIRNEGEKKLSCGKTLADNIKQNCMRFLPLYSRSKQPLNQRKMCETANASYIIMLFHHILWNVTLRLCLDRIFWMATNFHCWTTKCVPIRGLYYPSVNGALDIHVSVYLAAIPPAALISDQCFSANALCYSKLLSYETTSQNLSKP